MNYPQIIGITGKKFNGKDTLGEIFIKNEYQKFAFADPLKRACKEIFHLNDDQLYGDKKEDVDSYWNITPRKIYQYVGTELFRDKIGELIPEVGKDIWIKSIEKQILDVLYKNPSTKIVITDIRFKNELDAVKHLGGIIIRIHRSSLKSIDVHKSEADIDTFIVDYDISNDSTIEDLNLKVTNMFK